MIDDKSSDDHLDFLLFSMQQGKMFFIMGLCMAMVQGGYVRRIPHGKEMIAAMSVSIRKKLIKHTLEIEIVFIELFPRLIRSISLAVYLILISLVRYHISLFECQTRLIVR